MLKTFKYIKFREVRDEEEEEEEEEKKTFCLLCISPFDNTTQHNNRENIRKPNETNEQTNYKFVEKQRYKRF